MSFDKYLTIAGLIINAIGILLILFDSQAFVKGILNFMVDLISTIGFTKENPIDMHKIELLRNAISGYSKLNIRGFLLILVGFLIQILSLLF
ncbi:MAG TPA: hypothetical protein VIH57_10885 [Bacteroidales bacterium]|jgi:hypothetical protein